MLGLRLYKLKIVEDYYLANKKLKNQYGYLASLEIKNQRG